MNSIRWTGEMIRVILSTENECYAAQQLQIKVREVRKKKRQIVSKRGPIVRRRNNFLIPEYWQDDDYVSYTMLLNGDDREILNLFNCAQEEKEIREHSE